MSPISHRLSRANQTSFADDLGEPHGWFQLWPLSNLRYWFQSVFKRHYNASHCFLFNILNTLSWSLWLYIVLYHSHYITVAFQTQTIQTRQFLSCCLLPCLLSWKSMADQFPMSKIRSVVPGRACPQNLAIGKVCRRGHCRQLAMGF